MKLSLRKNKRRQGAKIRWMSPRDMPEILEIERKSFKNALTEQQIMTSMAQRTGIGIVAKRSNKIVGFALYDIQPESLCIISIAVDPRFRRRHVGRKLMMRILKQHRYRRKIITSQWRMNTEEILIKKRFLTACDALHGVCRNAITID